MHVSMRTKNPVKIANSRTVAINYSPSDELHLIQLPEGNTALLFMTNRSVIAITLEYYTGQIGKPSSGPHITSSITTPYSHFSATVLLKNSSTVYVYYQVNETALGEISFDLNNYTWTTEASLIPIASFES